MKWMNVSMSNDTDNSPVGVISTFSAEGLLIYSPNIGGLTVWGVRLSLSSSLHTGIAAARPRACVTWKSNTGLHHAPISFLESKTKTYFPPDIG